MTVSQETAQNVLRKHFPRLAQDISDPLVVATELFGKGIIGLPLLGRIRDVPATNHDKSTFLLEAVFNQIADDTGRFETFLAILRKDAPLRPLVDSMEIMWGRPQVQHEHQPHDGNSTGQPRGKNATGQPRGENATGQPRDENATGQPRGENATGQPRGENATGQPRDENATGQPRDENATGQPHDGNTTSKPHGENAAGQPHGENAAGQPHGENAAGQPHGENAAGQPHGENATGQARDENQQNVKKATSSATKTPDQILAVRIVKETTKTMKHKFTHLLTTACSKLKEKQFSAHDIEMFRLFLVSMCDEDKPRYKQKLRKILAKCSSFAEIFGTLTVNGFWSFWPNYDLLEGVIKEYAPELVQEMDTYTEDLSGFLLSTKMADYILSIDPQEKAPRYHDFEALSMKIDKVKVTEHSLKYIDDLWRSLVKKFSLPKWALLLHKVEEGCVSITWLVSSCAVHHLDGYMRTTNCASYFESMNTMEVTLGEKKYYPHVSGYPVQPSPPSVGSPGKPDPSSQATTPGKTALSIFQTHIPDLAVAIKDPGSLAKHLYSKGIITQLVRENVLNPLGSRKVETPNPLQSREVKNITLLQAMKTKLQTDPSAFTTLIAVLQSDPSLEPIATEMLNQEHEEVKLQPQTPRTIELSWRKEPDAPSEMSDGTTAVDGTVAYFSSRYSHTVYEYDSCKMEWSKLPEHPITFFSLAVVHGLLTTVGGMDHEESTDTLLSLIGEGEEREWREHFPPMPSLRSSPAVVCSGKFLVVAGGYYQERIPSGPPSKDAVTVVEVMNTDTLQWFTASSLPHPLSSGSATVIGNNPKIYLFRENGGVLTCSLSALLKSCENEQLTQNIVETFSPSQTRSVWNKVADIPVLYSTCATLNGHILAVGGCDSDLQPTTAVHMYDPTTDSWSVISHMSIPQESCLVALLPKDELMVVGGLFSQTNSVEVAHAK